jgi:hypothetical protein
VARLPWVLAGASANDPVAYVDLLRGGAQPPPSGANLLLHFADAATAKAQATLIAEALAAGSDAAVAAVIVAPPGALPAPPMGTGNRHAFLFSDDPERQWQAMFGVRAAPTTVIVDARGQETWRHEGALTTAMLAGALGFSLTRGGSLRFEPLTTGPVVGAAPPDLLLPYADGRCLPLRRLVGREVALAFWTSWATASLVELRRLARLRAVGGPLVIAINDGEDPELARRVLAELDGNVQLVCDVHRTIARAYGVACWPTIVWLDAHGRTTRVQLGRTATTLARLAAEEARPDAAEVGPPA